MEPPLDKPLEEMDGLVGALRNATRGIRQRGSGAVWCDAEYGWGPTVPDGGALTVCFCATMFELPAALVFTVLGVIRLVRAVHEPLVKPASSWRFNLKLFCTLACLACSFMLALLADPPSPALRLSLTVTCLGWGVGLALLVVGYNRALPQFTVLRVWWVAQFGINALVFLMHAELHTFPAVHEIRGAYCGFCVLLALLSVKPRDQPLYRAVVITPPRSTSPFPRRRGGGRGAHDYGGSAATISTPLLVPGIASRQAGPYSTDINLSHQASSAPDKDTNDLIMMLSESTDSDEDVGATLRRKLSSNLLISGATKSKYKKSLAAWNQALYGSRDRESDMAQQIGAAAAQRDENNADENNALDYFEEGDESAAAKAQDA